MKGGDESRIRKKERGKGMVDLFDGKRYELLRKLTLHLLFSPGREKAPFCTFNQLFFVPFYCRSSPFLQSSNLDYSSIWVKSSIS